MRCAAQTTSAHRRVSEATSSAAATRIVPSGAVRSASLAARPWWPRLPSCWRSRWCSPLPSPAGRASQTLPLSRSGCRRRAPRRASRARRSFSRRRSTACRSPTTPPSSAGNPSEHATTTRAAGTRQPFTTARADARSRTRSFRATRSITRQERTPRNVAAPSTERSATAAAGRSRGSAAATPVSSPARPPRRRSWSPSPTGAARAPSPSSRTAQRGPKTSGAEPLREHLLAELAALAALRLGLAEQRRQLVVAIAFRVLDVLLEAQRVRPRLLGKPDQVVVLVLRARYLAGLLGAAHAALLSLGLSRSLPSAGTGNARLAGRRGGTDSALSRPSAPEPDAEPQRSEERSGGCDHDRTRDPAEEVAAQKPEDSRHGEHQARDARD